MYDARPRIRLTLTGARRLAMKKGGSRGASVAAPQPGYRSAVRFSTDPADYAYEPPIERTRRARHVLAAVARLIGAALWSIVTYRWATSDDPWPTPFLAWVFFAAWALIAVALLAEGVQTVVKAARTRRGPTQASS